MFSKRGKTVAAIVPIEETRHQKKEGLICAKGVVTGIEDKEIDEMVDIIYRERDREN